MPETQETTVGSLGREDALKKELATHCGILALKIQWPEEPGGYRPWGRKESDATERLSTQQGKSFGDKTKVGEHAPTSMQSIPAPSHPHQHE